MQERKYSGGDNQGHSGESLFANRSSLTKLAGNYMQLLGIDPAKTFSNAGQPAFWDTEYLDPSGNKWGMHVMDSVRCLVDFKRTQSLLAGIKRTVEAIKQEGHQDIVGIDAGTGSGILAMGLVDAGCSKVYALEINPETIKVARRFIEKCGFGNEIEVIECDATKVDIAGIRDVDMLASENLSTGLFDEPQFQIIENLSKHLAPKAKIIPFSSKLFASLGWADWKDMGEEKLALANKLGHRMRASGMHAYMDVVSRRGMEVPHISGGTSIPILDHSVPINTLFISTKFQMDDGNDPITLDPDSAEFLGKTSAFRLPSSMQVGDGDINFRANYRVGYPSKLATVRIDKNLITLGSPND